MKNKFFYIFNLIFAIVLSALVAFFALVDIYGVRLACAETDEVLTDLQRDKEFNADNYTYCPELTSLEVITVAEGEGEQLFIYVYNPSMNPLYNATYIRMSYTIGNSYSPSDYALNLVSSSGVFQKYYVKDFFVKRDRLRYYDITCIFRKFVDSVDKDCETETKNYVRQVPFEVAKCYTACTLNGEVTYECEEVQTVTITDKFVATGEYADGFKFFGFSYTDYKTYAHFLAFSTDWDISDMYEADIEYKTQSYKIRDKGVGYLRDEAEYGDIVENEPVTLYADDIVTNNGHGWFHGDYSWHRIQSSQDFLSEIEANDTYLIEENARNLISSHKWVIAFAETEYTEEDYFIWMLDQIETGTVREGTLVSDVSILRLKFKSEGKIYNLGVVDNWQTGSNEPVFSVGENDFWNIFVKAVGIIIFLILLLVLLNFISPVMSVLSWILKGMVFVITAPFKLLKKLFKKDG